MPASAKVDCAWRKASAQKTSWHQRKACAQLTRNVVFLVINPHEHIEPSSTILLFSLFFYTVPAEISDCEERGGICRYVFRIHCHQIFSFFLIYYTPMRCWSIESFALSRKKPVCVIPKLDLYIPTGRHVKEVLAILSELPASTGKFVVSSLDEAATLYNLRPSTIYGNDQTPYIPF